MPHPESLVIEQRQALAAAAAEWVAAEIRTAVKERGRCAIALSGGTTPRAVYAELARRPDDAPWSHVDVFFGDERCVPPDDPASNFRMADASLLQHVPIPRERIHRMEGERPDPEGAASDYERSLPERLDILLLGVGPDGHTASLFPGAPALDERTRRVLAVESPVPPVHRLTITPPVIAAARRTAVLVTGAEKAPVVARVLEGRFDPHALPAQLALGAAWFVDRDAAAQLQRVPA